MALALAYKIKEKEDIANIFFFSIASGIPFLLLLSTLSIWLTEVGLSKTSIGLFAWATFPYTIKALIAPFIDKYEIPILTKLLGKRRSWLLVVQLFLAISICLLGWSDPTNNIKLTAISALMVGMFSAIQDIVVEAYRVEIVRREDISLASTVSVLGYRVGMLISGAGAIYCAAYTNSWSLAYTVMAMVITTMMLATIFSNEPDTHSNVSQVDAKNSVFDWINKLYIEPVRQFYREYNLAAIILFVLTFKVADTVLNVMSMPFLIEIGFSKIEIANVAKTFGIFSMILGGVFAGVALRIVSLYRVLLLCCVLQILACFLFFLQASLGHDLIFLFVTMGIENFVCGLGQVVLICYFSKLSHSNCTATRYALLSSFASLVRIEFSSISGAIADKLSWHNFYALVFGLSILCLVVLALFRLHFASLDLSKEH